MKRIKQGDGHLYTGNAYGDRIVAHTRDEYKRLVMLAERRHQFRESQKRRIA